MLASGKEARRTAQVILFAVLPLSLLCMAANLRWHFLDLEAIAVGPPTGQVKDFSVFRKTGMPFLISRDSLVARISVFADCSGEHFYRTVDGSTSNETDRVCFDGDNNDVLDSAQLHAFRNDPRIPFMSYQKGRLRTILHQRPKVLIIRTSAQGIVKSIRYLVEDLTLIQGVEINPAIIDLMRDELYERSGRAYDSVAVQNIDARAFLRHTQARYDLITMLNTYTVQVIGYFGEPDFVHTTDAFETYLDHLTDNGFRPLEEREQTSRLGTQFTGSWSTSRTC